ncbi:hypothetical protein HYS28_01135 [Candidatus Uhrbacteria bacterium]|nr:hypothetical protein [Candidatus Uhrbacteria bacterium]
MQEKGLGKYYVFALRAMADLTATIFVPAVVAALLGRFLDGRYGTGRAWFIGLLACTFVLTVFILIRKVRSYGRAYQKLFDKQGSEPGDGAARG